MDPLKYIFQKPMPTGKLAKWQILLSEFDIIYVTQKAVKGQALANHLAENPIGGEYEPLKTYFPNEDVSFVREDITETYDGWRMFFDGDGNFKRVGIGAVLVSETCQHYPVLGEWATKNTKILSYLYYVQELMKRFTKIEFKHVPRIQNEFTDALATLSSMIQHPDKNFIDPIPVGIHNQPAYCAHVEEETDGNPWFHDMKEYLAKGDTEVVIPTEVDSLRIIQKVELTDAEWIQSYYEQLALIDGKRMNAECHSQRYQNKMSRAFNKRVRPRQFTLGQLVLKRIFLQQDEAKGKFSPNWQGPYMVHRVLTG
ncbi:uncharacterized protein [Nicotiana tomentosiformis]|uniref:uncharacterized protein n=1 Tax=Nicotiana tomentosiformis TaxID=4098 RepID=UPI00388C6E1D